MLNFQTYRRLVSSFLLAIYLMVIAPVQIWHSHTGEAQIGEICQVDNGSLQVTSHSETLSPSDCAICSHHFSMHFDEVPAQPEHAFLIVNRQYADVVQHLHCSQLFLSSNKGPPTV